MGNRSWAAAAAGLCGALIACSTGGDAGSPTLVPAVAPTPSVPAPATDATPPVQTPTLPTPSASVIMEAAPDTLAHFSLFSQDLDQALQAAEASFFRIHGRTSAWNCLGDEIQGVCAGSPAGASLTGLPVTDDWQRYTVLDLEGYEAEWMARLETAGPLALHAVGSRFGDNPLMPAAAQAYLAVVVPRGNERPVPGQTWILFFEFVDNAYSLVGELRVTDPSSTWLQPDCLSCYDQWLPWSGG